MEEKKKGSQMWKIILAMVMVVTGCACFALSCIAALVVAGKRD